MLPEKNADQVAAASDEDFARELAQAAAQESAGLSDDQEGDLPLLEDKTPEVTDEAPADKTAEDKTVEEQAEEEDSEEVHNPNATLEDAEEIPDKVEEQNNSNPQFVKDAQNLAKKWESLSDSEQLDKVKNLAKSRPNTFKALAAELGTSTDLLLNQHGLDSTDYHAPEGIPEFDADAIAKKAEEAAYKRLKSEQGTESAATTNDRFVTEVSNYAKHNKLDAETQKQLSSFDGDVFKKFESLKFDPQTGGELSVKRRIALALEGNKDVQDALIASGVMKHSARVLNGVRQALPVKGKSAVTAPGKDLGSIAESNDAEFQKAMQSVTTGGVVPLEIS